MAIVIGSNFSYNGLLYLDERQGLPKTKEDLKNWSVSVPEGFEVYLPADGEWYVYKSTYNDTTTGHFVRRNQSNDDKITEINNNLEEIKKDIENKHKVIYVDTFDDLLLDSSWIIDGVNYSETGILVSVINDENNNGTYRLTSSDYKTAENWVKLLDRTDLITSEDDSTESSDTNIYTAKALDEKFTKKGESETVTGDWNFTHITAETSEIKDLPEHIFKHVKVGVSNMLRNTSFAGEYDFANFTGDTQINDQTILYSQPYEYWNGVGTWIINNDINSATGFSATLDSDSELSQTVEEEMLAGEFYVISYKAKGNITATVDNQTYTNNSDDYQRYEYKFEYSGADSCIVEFTGTGVVCEIKLEKGTVATSWFPSLKDTDRVADLINNYEYLKTAFKPYNDNCASGLLLKEIIQTCKYVDGETIGDAKAGMSGIYNNDGNVFVWSGGDYASASKLAGKLDNDPNYFPTDSELQNFAKFVVTFGGSVFVNARGKFRGGLTTRANGARVEIDPKDASLRLYNINSEEVFTISSGTDLTTGNGKFMITGKNWPTSDEEVEEGSIYLNNGVLSVKGVDVTIGGIDVAIPDSKLEESFNNIFN